MGQMTEELPAGATPPEKINILQKIREKEKPKEEKKKLEDFTKKETSYQIISKFWEEYLKRLTDPEYSGSMDVVFLEQSQIERFQITSFTWQRALLYGAPENVDTSGIKVRVYTKKDPVCYYARVVPQITREPRANDEE